MRSSEQKFSRFWRYVEPPISEMTRGAIWPLIPIATGFGIVIAIMQPKLAMVLAPLFFFIMLMFVVMGLLRSKVHVPVLIWTILLIALGFTRIGYDWQHNETRLFEYRYYGPIEGRIIDIDQSHSGVLRLTLDKVALDGRKVFGNVRISLHGDFHRERIVPAAIVQTTGHLSPPSGPAEPGGYDFRSRAWQDGLAAVGYTRNPTIASFATKRNFELKLLNWRLGRAESYREVLGDKIGGFASAIFIGDRSEIDQDVVDAMRKSNLAHLLAISGMHIGTVCGLVFMVMKRMVSLVPRFSSSHVSTRTAVCAALLFGGLYWIGSGASYSATRAFAMAMIFFMGIFALRQAISMRSVAYVAFAILLWQPSSLTDVGFQMSFSATIALIYVYGRMNVWSWRIGAVLKWVLILAITSWVAGMATAPFAAYHFHTVPKYGLVANLLAVPIMSFVVMPAGVLAAILEPVGADTWPLHIAGYGIGWIISIGEWVAGFDEPVWTIQQASHWVFISIICAGLIAIIGGKKGFAIGIAITIGAIVCWQTKERPLLLVAEDARFFGLMQEDVRKFSRATGHAFVAEIWSTSDGRDFDQARDTITSSSDPMIMELPEGWRFVFTTTQKGAAMVAKYCGEKVIIVAAQASPIYGKCLFYNEKLIFKMGGFALTLDGAQVEVKPNLSETFQPWAPPRKSSKSE